MSFVSFLSLLALPFVPYSTKIPRSNFFFFLERSCEYCNVHAAFFGGKCTICTKQEKAYVKCLILNLCTNFPIPFLSILALPFFPSFFIFHHSYILFFTPSLRSLAPSVPSSPLFFFTCSPFTHLHLLTSFPFVVFHNAPSFLRFLHSSLYFLLCRYGKPTVCQECLRTSAFEKGEEAKSKVGSQTLCFLCTRNYKRKLRALEKQSVKKRGAEGDAHNGSEKKRASTSSVDPPPPPPPPTFTVPLPPGLEPNWKALYEDKEAQAQTQANEYRER